jgi:hypothetical protein
MLRTDPIVSREAAMIGGYDGSGNLGGYDPRNATALAEAKATEAGLPTRRHIDAPRWTDVGTVVRGLGLLLLAILLGGWVLTLLNAR